LAPEGKGRPTLTGRDTGGQGLKPEKKTSEEKKGVLQNQKKTAHNEELLGFGKETRTFNKRLKMVPI